MGINECERRTIEAFVQKTVGSLQICLEDDHSIEGTTSLLIPGDPYYSPMGRSMTVLGFNAGQTHFRRTRLLDNARMNCKRRYSCLAVLRPLRRQDYGNSRSEKATALMIWRPHVRRVTS